MTKAQTKSFTFRIPADVYDVFSAQVTERNRSQFAVKALKQALGLADESVAPADLNLAARITELSHSLEVLRTEMKIEQDKILHRLAVLESTHLVSDKSQTVLQSNTESKTEEDNSPKSAQLVQLETLDEAQKLDAVDLFSMSEQMPSSDLLKILKEEDPSRDWLPAGLIRYRKGSEATKWHTIGGCKFMYTGNQKKIGRGKPQHLWHVIPQSASKA